MREEIVVIMRFEIVINGVVCSGESGGGGSSFINVGCSIRFWGDIFGEVVIYLER